MDGRITDDVRRKYDRLARLYDVLEAPMDSGMLVRWRKALWAEAAGRVLEVGVGTGRNIPFYPPGASVTALDFSPGMLQRARRRAAHAALPIEFHLMDVQQMQFPDDSFDTVVATCVFCTVPDPLAGLAEIRRVCRPGGRILLLEHVRSRRPFLGWLMDLLDPVVAGVTGTHINRDTRQNITRAGLGIREARPLWIDILWLFKLDPAK